MKNNMSMKQKSNNDICFFCKKKAHIKNECFKYKKLLENKGTLISLVCHESLLVNVPNNTWWIDSGTTIHIANTMQGFLAGPKETVTKRTKSLF